MPQKIKKEITFLVILILIGQLIFAFYSPKYTTAHFENRIFATLGIEFDKSDLHRLNEAAHYFGQTLIGWTKFPHFMENLAKQISLPEGSSINAHMQERQNIVFILYTSEPIEYSALVKTKDYLQNLIDEYNQNTNTNLILSNLDYDQAEIKRSFSSGALITLILSIVVGLGVIFLRRELL